MEKIKYTYQGTTLCYRIIEGENKTWVIPQKDKISGDVVIPAEITYNGATYIVTGIGCLLIIGSVFADCKELTSITIPNSVTEIASSAFSGCSSLTSITIPNSVTYIGDSAFKGCDSLTSIEIPNSVTFIGDYAFACCSRLTSIEIPNSVTSIGKSAFSGCSSLTRIEIPNSVTRIEGAFSNCSGLEIVVEAGNPKYDSRDNCNAIIETSTNTLVAGCENTIIPSSVTTIGESAFRGCSGLTNVELPDSVTEIGRFAFEKCTGLTAIKIPNSVTFIGDYAFACCSRLTSIEIPNSVTSIGKSAFSGCTGLTSIEIPSSVTEIDKSAFDNCSSLKSIVVEAGNPKYDSRDNCNAIIETSTNTLIVGCENTIIPNSVTSIGRYAFDGRTGLTTIKIHSSVTEISGSSFGNCSSLKSIVVEAGNPKYDSRDNCNAIIDTSRNALVAGCENTIIPDSVTKIWADAFKGRNSLTSITIPNSVTSIGMYAFKGCTGLTSIEIPDSVTVIESSTFEDCNSLTSITIPDSVTVIEPHTFEDCNSLTSITIPNSVKEIGNFAFENCTKLESITIGTKVKEISSRAFKNCESLRTIYSMKSKPPAIEGCFTEIPPREVKLFVPKGKVDNYKCAEGWEEFTNIEEMVSNTKKAKKK